METGRIKFLTLFIPLFNLSTVESNQPIQPTASKQDLVAMNDRGSLERSSSLFSKELPPIGPHRKTPGRGYSGMYASGRLWLWMNCKAFAIAGLVM